MEAVLTETYVITFRESFITFCQTLKLNVDEKWRSFNDAFYLQHQAFRFLLN